MSIKKNIFAQLKNIELSNAKYYYYKKECDVMKKKFIAFVIFFSLFITFSVCVNARDYCVDEYNVNVKINEDGSASFEEKINFNFNGIYNGIFLNIDYRDCGEFVDYSISKIENENEVLFQNSDFESENTYQLSFDDDIAKFKIFSHSENQNKTFLLKYKLTKVTKKYVDTAQFNRKLLGENFEAPIRNFNALISFEYPAKSSELKIFAHGPLTGESKINDDGTISLMINDLPANNFIEANVLFPNEYVKNLTEISNEKTLSQIMEQEKQLAIDANKIREDARKEMIFTARMEKIKKIILVISLFIIIITDICVIIYTYIKNKTYYLKHFEGDYYRELPAEYTPVEMSYLFRNIGSKDIMATLLDLARKKFISIEQEEKIGILNSKIDYKITLLENKNYSDLKSHEKKLIQWLIEDIGDGKSVYLSKIKQDSKKYSVQFNTKYEEWIREANTTSQLLNNFFEPVNNNLSKSIIRLLVIALPFFLLITSSDLFFVIIFMFVIIISIIIMGIISLYKRRTQEAQLEYEKWLAFKKFLKDFSNLNDAQIGSIVLWEHYLVYAVSLGVAKQVIKQLPLVFTKNDLESNNLVLIPFFCSSHDNFDHFENLNSQFQQSISSAKNIAQSKNSSITGSGGGFSSGSSGGSGSRGGGGAF